MAIISRSTTWADGQTLTASALNAEFNVIQNDYNGNVTNANISNAAAIAYSKLNLTGNILNTDIGAGAAIAYSKLNLASSVKESDLNLTNVTTGNVSASAHGFAPKFPNNTTTFLRGDGTYAAIGNFFVGSFTRDLSVGNGNVAYTGVGFTPKLVQFYYMGPSGGSGLITGVGAMTTANQHAYFNSSSEPFQDSSNSVAIYLSNVGGTNNQAAFASMDADGFTLTWTKAGSPTGVCVIQYVAFG